MNERRRRPSPSQAPALKPAVSTSEPRRMRAALSQTGGAVEAFGDAALARVLAEALAASEGPTDSLTHGFHTYPARMHPAIAAHLLHALSQPGERVLDPFCGSGTVLVEALVAGCRGSGVDLNPLALRIAQAHVAHPGPRERERFGEAATQVASASLERVRARHKTHAPLSPEERAFYDPHVLLELAGLREEISAIPAAMTRRMLELVLSSIIVKVSKQRADTAQQLAPKRIRKGLTTEIFERKARELLARWAELSAVLPAQTFPVELHLADARTLPDVTRGPFELILSSPPYGGTYDYHAHHARRYPWLELDASALAARELGARRTLSNARDAVERWDEELLACLRAMAAVLAREGVIVLLQGDAQLSGRRVDAHQQLARLAKQAGLRVHAGASQLRPDFLGGAPRREHLIALVHAR